MSGKALLHPVTRRGYFCVKRADGIRNLTAFDRAGFHLGVIESEWAVPDPPQGEGQQRGNSGVCLMGRYEIQILDSYRNPTYAAGSAASLFGQHGPLANACRKPGEWQTDIVFRAPRFRNGKVTESGRVTLFHNGVLALDHAEIHGPILWRALADKHAHAPEGPILLQDHAGGKGSRFRNIWVRRLDLAGKG